MQRQQRRSADPLGVLGHPQQVLDEGHQVGLTGPFGQRRVHVLGRTTHLKKPIRQVISLREREHDRIRGYQAALHGVALLIGTLAAGLGTVTTAPTQPLLAW